MDKSKIILLAIFILYVTAGGLMFLLLEDDNYTMDDDLEIFLDSLNSKLANLNTLRLRFSRAQ